LTDATPAEQYEKPKFEPLRDFFRGLRGKPSLQEEWYSERVNSLQDSDAIIMPMILSSSDGETLSIFSPNFHQENGNPIQEFTSGDYVDIDFHGLNVKIVIGDKVVEKSGVTGHYL
jgi:hypothetical protein